MTPWPGVDAKSRTGVDLGVLLSVPLDSVAVRAVLATFLGIVLARALLQRGLRAPRARAASAIAPAGALVAVLIVSGVAPQLPIVMVPSDAGTALPIPVSDGYLHFAPMALPLLLGVWGVISALLLARRAGSAVLLRRRVRRLFATSRPPDRVVHAVTQAAAALELSVPRIAAPPSCPGGAYVVGLRRPVAVIGRDLVARLDDHELEAVVAHELAHVKRRDLLVAAALGVLRDLTFFVPGGGWALRQLHRERELAADQAAVATTGRPGALASGLLKVMDTPRRTPASAVALAPSTHLVDRIRVLVDEEPRPSRTRRNIEFATVAVVTGIAVTGALVVPGFVAGAERERDAVALVWSNSPVTEPPLTGEPRVFDVYRRTELHVPSNSAAMPGQHAEHRQENRRRTLRACADDGCTAPSGQASLGIRPPTVMVDRTITESWRATPVGSVEAGDGFQVFWLARTIE